MEASAKMDYAVRVPGVRNQYLASVEGVEMTIGTRGGQLVEEAFAEITRRTSLAIKAKYPAT